MTDATLVKDIGLLGPMARAAGVAVECRRDHPYAAYDRVEFDVITESGCDVWSRLVVRMKEVFEAIRIIRQCLEKMEPGPLQAEIKDELPIGRLGLSSVEAPRGEDFHYVLTGEGNRPYRWKVRAPSYPNLQAIPTMIQGQMVADMPIALGSIDPCFSCTERLETVDVKTGAVRVFSQDELLRIAREGRRCR